MLTRAQQGMRDFDRVVRWLSVGNLHLTVKFLGEVRDDDVASVCDAARRAADRSGPIGFALCGLGCFPPKGPARIVWAGVSPDGEGLLGCQQAVEQEMGPLGFSPERRAYSPHLTIGRVRPGQNTEELRTTLETRDLQSPAQHPSDLVVFESNLTPRGAIYTAIARCPLGVP